MDWGWGCEITDCCCGGGGWETGIDDDICEGGWIKLGGGIYILF